MSAHNDGGREPLLIDHANKLVTEKEESKPIKSNFLASMGNFNIQYNFSCLSIAIAIMTSQADITDDDIQPDFPEPEWAKYVIQGLVFAGAVLGMLIMGSLADMIGRRLAMLVTLNLVAIGAFGSCFFTFGGASDIYGVLAACRLILGVGVGGIYPVAAATAYESASGNSAAEEESRVGWAFFWQSPGSMVPYVVAWILLQLPKGEATTSVQFRLLLGIGGVLALIPVASVLADRQPAVSSVDVDLQKRSRPTPWSILLENKQHWRTLLGTAGTWFLYDISYYGSVIFTPNIIEDIFGKNDSLNALCWQSIVVGAMGIPGSASAIMLLKHRSGKWLSCWGFGLLAACFSALAITYNVSPDGVAGAKFAIFCITSFALNWGPNVSTYVLPTSCYPANSRATFHGLSAAGGKIGAVIGTFMYPAIQSKYGIGAVLWVQVVTSIAGAIVSLVFLPAKPKANPHKPLLLPSQSINAVVALD